MKNRVFLILCFFLLNSSSGIRVFAQKKAAKSSTEKSVAANKGFVDAASFGFSPEASGIENSTALQKAVDQTGTIVVGRPGTYKMAGTVYVGSNTSLIFGNNVFLKKVDEQGAFSHVIVNKGAVTKTYDEHITIDGLNIIVNGMDVRKFKEAYGLHGQVAFFTSKT